MKNTQQVNKRNNVHNPLQEDYGERIIRFLICLVAGLVPIIVYCKLQNFYMPAIEDNLTFRTTSVTDYFTYYKGRALLILIFLIVMVFALKNFLEQKKAWSAAPIELPILIFVLSLSLTVTLADYKSLTIWGGYTRNFGVMAYLCCTLFFWVMVNLRITGKWYELVLISLYPLVILNTVMILLANNGINLWDVDGILSLLSAGQGDYLSQDARIYGTLNHVNYLSGLGAVLFALFAGAGIFSEKNASVKIISLESLLKIVAAVLGAVIVYASQSMSGAVTMAFVVPLLLAFSIRAGGKKLIYGLTVMLLTALAWGVLIQQAPSFFAEIKGSMGMVGGAALLGLILFGVFEILKNWHRISKKVLGAACAVFVLASALAAVYAGPKVQTAFEAEMARIDTRLIEQRLEKDPFDFPESGFTWGTGRIYIWKETLKLVMEKPVFGYGFDTLPFEFDQTDPAKIPAMERPDVIIDKPHNTYINMLFGGGFLGLLAYLSIICAVLYSGLRALAKDHVHSGRILALVIGILAYLMQGMFNDPVQGFESLFWVLLGLCYGLSRDVPRTKKGMIQT